VLRSQSEDDDDRGKRNRVSQATLLPNKYNSSKICSIFKRLRRELKVWQRLNHDNVLPLYGTTSDFGPYSSMVCPWADNGSLSKYLEKHGTTLTSRERFGIVSKRIVHGWIRLDMNWENFDNSFMMWHLDCLTVGLQSSLIKCKLISAI